MMPKAPEYPLSKSDIQPFIDYICISSNTFGNDVDYSYIYIVVNARAGRDITSRRVDSTTPLFFLYG